MLNDLAHWLHELAHQEWFILLDLAFHIVIVGHVVAHICRLGKRVHNAITAVWPHRHTSS